MSGENEQDIVTTTSSNICVTNVSKNVLKYFDRDTLGLRCTTLLAEIIDTVSDIDYKMTDFRHKASSDKEDSLKTLLQKTIETSERHIRDLNELHSLISVGLNSLSTSSASIVKLSSN